MLIEHYKRIIALLPEATVLLTHAGTLVAGNKSAKALLGSAVADASSIIPLVMSPGHDDLLAYLRRCARSGEPIVGAMELKTPEGVLAYTAKGAVLQPRSAERDALLLLRILPRRETNARFKALKSRIDELNVEVAKRKHAEYELRAETRWLEVTLASIGDAVITTDARNRVAFMNPAAEAMTGWTQNEAAGVALKEVFVVVNEYTAAPVENPADRALREGEVIALANHSVLIAKNGAHISIEDTAAPIILDDHIRGAILVFHDVSARRLLEKQLMERAENLELANRRKNEFLTMLAHELRSPLAPISNAMEIMRMEKSAPASFDEPQQVVSRQVQHLKRLIDDMLDVSRITSGRMNIVRRKVDVASLVSLACSDFHVQFSQSRIYFNTSVPPSEVWVLADADRLTQVLHNLLINAIKFTPPGGSTSVSLTVEGPFAVLAVKDSGIGIDESVMADLFEPFTQATQSLDRSAGGLGLGLSLVKGIVDLHDGQVSASSEGRHKGATITVRLPLASREETLVEPEQNATEVTSRRILLIEDEADAAETMRQLLELLGHEVYIESTGPEGLKKAMAIVPTLVICDIGLPGLDGFAVAERLRQNRTTESVTLVALTGYGDSDFVERARKAGFDQHITKPATLDDIQGVLSLPNSRPAR